MGHLEGDALDTERNEGRRDTRNNLFFKATFAMKKNALMWLSQIVKTF